jgi:hypothetical protein
MDTEGILLPQFKHFLRVLRKGSSDDLEIVSEHVKGEFQVMEIQKFLLKSQS